MRAPLHSPGTEHFPSLSLISSQRKYLPQVNTTLRPLGHPLCPALSCPCPGACLGLNPQISASTGPNTHLRVSPLHTALGLPSSPGLLTAPLAPAPTTLDVVLHAPLRKPLSLSTPSSSTIPSSLCLKFNLIYISPGVTKYAPYQPRCLRSVLQCHRSDLSRGRLNINNMSYVTGIAWYLRRKLSSLEFEKYDEFSK